MKLRIDPAAEIETREAALWYRPRHRPRLGLPSRRASQTRRHFAFLLFADFQQFAR